MYLQLVFSPKLTHDGLKYELSVHLNTYMSSLHKILDPNMISHQHMSNVKKLIDILETVQKKNPIYELIEFIPLDGQAKENSKHAAERSSRLLQVGLVRIVGWLRCVAFVEVFAAVDYQPVVESSLGCQVFP